MTGSAEGTATLVDKVIARSEPRGDKPGASIVLNTDSAKIVAFEFAAGGELHEHAAHHPVLIQVMRGAVDFILPDRTERLVPGTILHVTAQLRHSVRAIEPSTLTVTMLLSAERGA